MERRLHHPWANDPTIPFGGFMHSKLTKIIPFTFALGISTTAVAAAGTTVQLPDGSEGSEGAGAGPSTEPTPTTSVQTAVNSVTTAATTAAGGYTDADH